MATKKPTQLPASKPRNFVAKNMTTSGAGAHKDKKKAEKQGQQKHKNKSFDMAEDASTLHNYLGKRKESPVPATVHKAVKQVQGVRSAKEKIHDKENAAALKSKGDPRVSENYLESLNRQLNKLLK